MFSDSVKTLLARVGGVNLVCLRLEQLLQKHEAGNLDVTDSDVHTVMKHACDLIIIVLTGGEKFVMLHPHAWHLPPTLTLCKHLASFCKTKLRNPHSVITF